MDVEQTIREWHDLKQEAEALRTDKAALTARCEALEEGLNTANAMIKEMQTEVKAYMKLTVEAVMANNDAAAILNASVQRSHEFVNGKQKHDVAQRRQLAATVKTELADVTERYREPG